MSSRMVLSLVFLLFLQQCTCFTTTDTNLEVNNDPIDYATVLLKLTQFMETVHGFRKDWNDLQTTVSQVIRDVKKSIKQDVIVKSFKNEMDDLSMPHSNYDDDYLRRSKPPTVHLKSAGDILVYPVEKYFDKITNEIEMFENEINFLSPLLELQMKSSKDYEPVVRWAHNAILSAEEYFSQFINNQTTGYKLIKKMHKTRSKYDSQRIEIEKQKLKDGVCSNTDTLSHFLCQTYDQEDD